MDLSGDTKCGHIIVGPSQWHAPDPGGCLSTRITRLYCFWGKPSADIEQLEKALVLVRKLAPRFSPFDGRLEMLTKPRGLRQFRPQRARAQRVRLKKKHGLRAFLLANQSPGSLSEAAKTKFLFRYRSCSKCTRPKHVPCWTQNSVPLLNR